MIDLNTILNEDEGEPKNPSAICFYPGGFKPPHEGHFEVAKDLSSRPYVTNVKVLIGHSTRDGITKEQSKKIWDLYLNLSPSPNINVEIAANPSPIKDIFSIMDNDLELNAYVAGVQGDPDTQNYFDALTKAFGDRVKPLPVEEKVVTKGKRLSGTQVRELVNEVKKSILNLRSVSDKNSTEYSKARNEYLIKIEELKGCFPEVVIQKGGFDDILKILGIPVLNIDQLQEDLFTINWWKNSLSEFKLDVNPTVDINDVDKEELKKGIKVEKEHTSDIKTATRIALNHLSEDPKYYSKLEKVGLEETLAEPQQTTDNTIADFIDFAAQALNLQKLPKITFSDDEQLAKNMHSLGAYNPQTDELLVVKGPRLTADILRTLAHELVHRKQAEMKPLTPEDGKTGSEVENEANAAAGVLLRQFGKYRPEIFTEADASKGDYKIYCDMDGVLVDFEKGYKDLTGVEASYDTNPEEFWEPITRAGAAFWIKLQWMPDGKQLWEYIKPYSPELLSAPSREESSRIGKFTWVKRNIPGTKLILRSAERKQEFATPNSILIDDRADNIQRWKDAGGIGIHHTSAADTIQQLKDLGL
jgi:hypothetical protein